MFVIKGRLKVTLLVIGALVVSLGMYAGFQAQETLADNKPNDPHSNHLYIRRVFTTEWYVGMGFWYVNKPCPYCGKLRLYTKYGRIYNYYDTTYRYILSWDHETMKYHDKKRSAIKERTETISTSSMCFNPDCPEYGGG